MRFSNILPINSDTSLTLSITMAPTATPVSNSISRFRGVNVAIEPVALLLVAVENNRLAQAQGHCRFRVLSVALLFTCTVDKKFGAFDHETFDEAVVFMSSCSAQSGIEISKRQRFYSGKGGNVAQNP